MRNFDINEAKAGAAVCTRSGRRARLICTNLKCPDYQIIAAVWDDIEEMEEVILYTDKGEYNNGKESHNDLMMVEGEEPKCPFKPFDKVLVRENDEYGFFWDCSLFSRYNPDDEDEWFWFITLDGCKNHMCIPYNEETEHLIGTTDDAPEKYVIW